MPFSGNRKSNSLFQKRFCFELFFFLFLKEAKISDTDLELRVQYKKVCGGYWTIWGKDLAIMPLSGIKMRNLSHRLKTKLLPDLREY